MYFAFILVDYLNRFGFLSYILSPISYVLNKVKFKNTYFGNNGFWHDPNRVKRIFSALGKSYVYTSDTFYRFDIKVLK